MKITLLILFLFLLLLAGCLGKEKINDQYVINGEIDLKKYNQDIIPLKGMWKFKYIEKDSPVLFDYIDQMQWDYMQVPSLPEKENVIALYSVTIYSDSLNKIGIYIGECLTSYELYANDILLIQTGKAGFSRQDSIPKLIPKYTLLPASDKIAIVIKISNFHTVNTGIIETPFIGKIGKIRQVYNLDFFLDVFFLGMVFSIGLYIFIIWFGTKKDNTALYLAIGCFIVFIRFLFVDSVIDFIIPEEITLFMLRYKINYTTGFLQVVFLALYVSSLFPEKNKDWIKKTLFIMCSILILLALILDISFLVKHMNLFFNGFIILVLIYVVYLLIGILRSRKIKLLHLIIVSVVLISLVSLLVIYEILKALSLINTWIYLTPIAVIIILFIQAIYFSRAYANRLKRLQHLSRNLQTEVESRTLELKQAKELIEQQSRERTAYFINLAHELKTPLTLINNSFDHYLERNFNADAVPDDLAVMKYYLEHSTGDIVNLLEMESLERGEINYKHDRIIDIEDALSKTVQLFMQAVKDKRITFISQAIEHPYVKIHPYAFERIINNIIENAVKYTKDEISITLNTGYSDIFIEIADNGPGIPDMHLEKIFNPYYQISREKSNFEGLGMGLAIVNRILSRIRGKISLKNKPDNSGLVVTIILPKCVVSKENESMLIKEYTPKVPVKKTIETRLFKEVYEKGRATVFLVEDNRELVSFFQKAMYKEFNFFYAFNGEEALQKLGEIEKPDIIISDIMMDTMDGYEFHENIVCDETLNDIPFLFLTARTNLHEKLESLSRGAIDYIYKPFVMKEVLEKVRAITGNRRAQTEHLIKTLAPSPELKAEEEALLFERVCKAHRITKTEKMVIREFLKGLLNKEIGTNLFMSENTVRNHINSIYKKLEVNTKIELYNKFKLSL